MKTHTPRQKSPQELYNDSIAVLKLGRPLWLDTRAAAARNDWLSPSLNAEFKVQDDRMNRRLETLHSAMGLLAIAEVEGELQAA